MYVTVCIEPRVESRRVAVMGVLDWLGVREDAGNGHRSEAARWREERPPPLRKFSGLEGKVSFLKKW